MQTNNSCELLTAPMPVGSGDLLGILVFLICFGISLPFGMWLGLWWMTRNPTDDLTRSRVEHVPKLGERREHLVVYLFALCRVQISLLLLKIKLLLQKALLKAIGQAARNQSANQGAEKRAANTGEENIVCHKNVKMPNEKS
jgi:hypothetical protein